MSEERLGLSIGQLLRNVLQERSLSMRKLGELTDIDTATISRIINDKRKATLDHLEKFSTILEIPLAKLLQAAGYPVENEKTSESAYDETIQQLADTSGLLSANFSIEKVEDQLAGYKAYVQTKEGRERILHDFEMKLKIAGGVGPFVDQLKELYNRFKMRDAAKRDLAVIGSALLYFIVPVDVIPDYLFAVGYLDDAVAVQIASSVLTKNS
ncbi:DNA-binding protein [Sporosarcina sp. P37]|uniref:DUF1232 domain-containing protein n=1 Tax=unclassified Sporosarcina TaxID=2647733 RepID=UPI0009BDD686|nr:MULTISPECIES: DUF1232 domain-containing protein [unclassified Sporosarcina]ARD47097.1 DNA-binding protein [Sporosarcina sp. P33]ARK23645.1 DNA-binding protein [Sporosarcina sp. P37]PID18731.1 DNA-binding protein [Sporosarcina sp. P35]